MNVQVSTRIPKEIKEKATKVVERQGLDLPTAIKIFVAKTAQENKIPLRIDEPALIPNDNLSQIVDEAKNGIGLSDAMNIDEALNFLEGDNEKAKVSQAV